MVCGGDLGEGRACLELVDDFCRLGIEARCDLLVAPALLYLLLYFIEGAFP